MEAGAAHGITPYGTETMHVLRAEKGFIIVGQDTDGSVTPIDLGMDWIVAKGKKDFPAGGRSSRADMVRDDRKQLVGLLTEDPAQVLPGGRADRRRRLGSESPCRCWVTSRRATSARELKRSIALAVVRDGIERCRCRKGIKAGRDVLYAWAGGNAHKVKVVSPVFVGTRTSTRQQRLSRSSSHLFIHLGLPIRRDRRTQAAAVPTRSRSRATSASGEIPSTPRSRMPPKACSGSGCRQRPARSRGRAP